jgi:hypothetical protein
MNAPRIVVVFDIDHQTKNTVVFKERRPEKGESVVGTLYVRKEYFESLDRPNTLRVDIYEAVEE